MATRFYTHPGSAPPVTPAYAGWNTTAAAVRRVMSLAKDAKGLGAETLQTAEAVATSPYDVLLGQFVSGPISGTPTIAGTIKGQIRVQEQLAAADFQAQLVAKIVSNDGATLRGTLLTFDASALGASEWSATTYTNRKFPLTSPAAMTSVTCVDGDRLVIEVGYRALNTVTTSYNGGMDIRQSAGTDLAVDETTTTANDSWFEISDTISLKPEGRFTSLIAEVAGRADAGVRSRLTSLVMEVAIANDLGGWEILVEGDF